MLFNNSNPLSLLLLLNLNHSNILKRNENARNVDFLSLETVVFEYVVKSDPQPIHFEFISTCIIFPSVGCATLSRVTLYKSCFEGMLQL